MMGHCPKTRRGGCSLPSPPARAAWLASGARASIRGHEQPASRWAPTPVITPRHGATRGYQVGGTSQKGHSYRPPPWHMRLRHARRHKGSWGSRLPAGCFEPRRLASAAQWAERVGGARQGGQLAVAPSSSAQQQRPAAPSSAQQHPALSTQQHPALAPSSTQRAAPNTEHPASSTPAHAPVAARARTRPAPAQHPAPARNSTAAPHRSPPGFSLQWGEARAPHTRRPALPRAACPRLPSR